MTRLLALFLLCLPLPATAQQIPLPAAHDLSPMGMFAQAHWVVQAVMLALLAACFVTWTIWLFKTVELALAGRALRHSQAMLHRAPDLAATTPLAQRQDPAARMAQAVQAELALAAPHLRHAGPEGVKERAVSLVARIEGQALARLRRGTGLLATIGAIAPFVGLFGTVWGIMSAFIGIAEALFATALGLVAAIPAVVIYNLFSRASAAYRLRLGDAGAATLRLLSRDIDRLAAQEG